MAGLLRCFFERLSDQWLYLTALGIGKRKILFGHVPGLAFPIFCGTADLKATGAAHWIQLRRSAQRASLHAHAVRRQELRPHLLQLLPCQKPWLPRKPTRSPRPCWAGQKYPP